MIDYFFSHFNQISVSFLLFVFVLMWVKKRLSGQSDNLESIIGNSLASATIPTAIALILCAFNENLVIKLNGLNLHLSVAGVVLLFVALKTIEKDW